MRNLLITGGCGFIGTNLVGVLERDGRYRLSVLDNESLGTRENLGAFSGRFFKLDLADSDELTDVLAGVDVVVHLAAQTRVIDSIQFPERNFRDNVIGTFRLLEACRKAGVRRFINASTGGAILGEAPTPVHEDLVPRPLSPYGASKLASEAYCFAYTASFGASCVSLRFSNIYGPRSSHKESVVALFLKRILAGQDLVVYGDGTQVRDYLFVGDLIEGIVQAIESDAVGTYQLGSGLPTTVNELIAVITDVVGSRRMPAVRYEAARRGEVHSTWCNIAKARQAFNFDPKIPLKDGIARTWAWFQQSEELGGNHLSPLKAV